MTKSKCLRHGKPWEIEAQAIGICEQHDAEGAPFLAHMCRFIIERRGSDTLEVYSAVDKVLLDAQPEETRSTFLWAEALSDLAPVGVTDLQVPA